MPASGWPWATRRPEVKAVADDITGTVGTTVSRGHRAAHPERRRPLRPGGAGTLAASGVGRGAHASGMRRTASG